MICPYCGHHIANPSREHILPRARGGRFDSPIASNKRIVCSSCNHARAMAGECVGALACAFAVAATMTWHKWSNSRHRRVRRVLAAWQLMEGARQSPRDRFRIAVWRAQHLRLPPPVRTLEEVKWYTAEFG